MIWSVPEQRQDIDYDAFKASNDAEPNDKTIEEWVEGETSELDDPEDFYGNNYTPGLGWL